MTEKDMPLRRSIGLGGVIRFLITLGAVIAIAFAFAEGNFALGILGGGFIVVAVVLGYLAWRARESARRS